MRRVAREEIKSRFLREIAWGDDERHLYNPNRKKAAVMSYLLRLETIVDLVERHSKGKQVIDLACGQGNVGLMLAEKGYDVKLVDINSEFLDYAKLKHTHGQIDTQCANFMDYRDEPGDCVILGEIIEHVAFPKDLLRSAYENLKPGGLLVITTPNGAAYNSTLPTYSQIDDVTKYIPRQFHWGEHLFLYTEDELKGLAAETGFETIETVKINSAWSTQIKGVRYAMPKSLLSWIERNTREWKKHGKEATDSLIFVARKK